jgi:ABC-type nitrate/sulfonate/bicarbonate transport system substrate-binding protein
VTETLKLIQFRAAYNLPVHAGIETGIFARHGLSLEIVYTPDSLQLSQALKEGRCDIGHTGADDVIADVENDLHSGLFTLVGARECASIDSLSGRSIGVDARTSGFGLVLERMLQVGGFIVAPITGWSNSVDGKAAIVHCWKERSARLC